MYTNNDILKLKDLRTYEKLQELSNFYKQGKITSQEYTKQFDLLWDKLEKPY